MPFGGASDADFGNFDWDDSDANYGPAGTAGSGGTGGLGPHGYDWNWHLSGPNKGGFDYAGSGVVGPEDSAATLNSIALGKGFNAKDGNHAVFMAAAKAKAQDARQGRGLDVNAERAYLDATKAKGSLLTQDDVTGLNSLLGLTPEEDFQQITTTAFNRAMQQGFSDPGKAVADFLAMGGNINNTANIGDDLNSMVNEALQQQNMAGLVASYVAAREGRAREAGVENLTLDDLDATSLETTQAALADALGNMGGTDFLSYESFLDAVERGVPWQDLMDTPGVFGNVLAKSLPYVGTFASIADFLLDVLGEKVIGTFTHNGRDYNLHEDGRATLTSPMDTFGGPDSFSDYNLSDNFAVEDLFTSGQEGFNRQDAIQALTRTILEGEGLDEFRPGFSGDERNNALISELLTQNQALGEDVTESDFNQAFNADDIGRELLLDVEGNRQGFYRDRLGETFTGEAFAPEFDDDIISRILDERASGPQKTLSNVTARGNLNTFGGQTANEALNRQRPEAQERLEQISGSLLGETQRSINELRDTALTGITDFRLGGPAFDFTDALTGRRGLVDDRTTSLRGDIETALGSEPLFDVNQALATGRGTQGVVSGTGGSSNLLDTIAQREAAGAATASRRGLGSRGSGAF